MSIMATAEASYMATLQHIRLIADRRRHLEQVQRESEEQFVHAVAREFRAGRLTFEDLEAVYLEARAVVLAGFATKRWQAELPPPGRLQWLAARAAKEVQQRQDDLLDSWHGRFPVEKEERMPPPGTCVVYVLYDHAGAPCYVGSTGWFYYRTLKHAYHKKSATRWQAYRCRDRQHAYEVEERFLQRHKPYLNKNTKVGR